ncbi:(2Fe-2S)-binding protein [bacterium]|nr:(2Fe-2S)-binding protein [bacterium]
MKIRLKLNGSWREFEISNDDTLLHVLRDELRLTGTKRGCGNGECGACTVILDGETVTSCLVLAASVDGSSITTIEGISPQRGLHPIQEGLVANGGVQCGFCTPGFVVSAYDFLSKRESFTMDELKRALSGNLCRCTGYKKIVEGVVAGAETMGKEIEND